MKSFETSTTVQPQGDVRVAGVPFAPGTEVEVSISPKRKDGADFAAAWQQVCGALRRSATKEISDDDIQKEVDDYRAGR